MEFKLNEKDLDFVNQCLLREGCLKTFQQLFKDCDKEGNHLLVMEEFKEFLKQSHDNLSSIDFIVDRKFAIADKNLDSYLTV